MMSEVVRLLTRVVITSKWTTKDNITHYSFTSPGDRINSYRAADLITMKLSHITLLGQAGADWALFSSQFTILIN